MTFDLSSLESLAADATMDFSKWPPLLEPIIRRFETIIETEFPPVDDTSSYSVAPARAHTTLNDSSSALRSINISAAHNDLDPSLVQRSALPASILEQVGDIECHLRTRFQRSPPHTVQRLAQLILHPTQHYRTLPAYLRAVERVVSVSSAADNFPISPMHPLPASLADIVMNNGGSSSDKRAADNYAAGAELSPIPWLQKPSTRASTPRSEVAVAPSPRGGTNGSLSDSLSDINSSSGHVEETNSGSDTSEAPHARGPSVVDVNDVGLQHGQSVEIPITSDDSPSAETSATITKNGDSTLPQSEEDAPQTQPVHPLPETTEASNHSLNASRELLETKEASQPDTGSADDEIDMRDVDAVQPDGGNRSDQDQESTQQGVKAEISRDEKTTS